MVEFLSGIAAKANDVTVPVTFHVFAPIGVGAKIIGTNNFSKGVSGVGMVCYVYFYPFEVSFSHVSVLEVGGDSSNISGYYTSYSTQELHHVTQGWEPVNLANFVQDTAGMLNYKPNWCVGSFDVVIPMKWRIAGTELTNDFMTITQSFNIDAQGTTTVSKYGRSMTRFTNNLVEIK